MSCTLFFINIEAWASPIVLYRTALSILSLPHEVAVKGGLAELTGTVTLSSPRGIVLQDSTAGIWVDWRSESKHLLAIGDVVTVIGEVGSGAYSPEIEYASVRLSGHAELPKPRNVSFVELSSGQEDAQYVSIEGVIRTVTLRSDALTTVPAQGLLLTVDMPEGRVDVALPTQYYEAASKLIDARAQIVGTVLVRKNDDMQQIGVLLVSSDIRNVMVVKAGSSDLFSSRIVPVASLLQYGSHTDYFHRIGLRGTLTYYERGKRLILQDESRAIEVFPAGYPSLQVGDRIEAIGFPTPDVAGPSLHDAVVRRITQERPLAPMSITLQEALTSRYRSCLISLHLKLVRVISEPARTILLLESGHDLTSAELAGTDTTPSWLRPGSDLRLTGINMLTVEGGANYLNYHDATAHSVLLLRSLNDISLISPATWWTQRHLLYISIALAILLASFLFLLMYVQLKRWKIESTLRERERLARDVHDTLAQSFAGVGFQLQVIRRAMTTGDPNLTHHIDTARELVQFSHREARKSLMPSSSEDSVGPDLLSSLEENAQTLVKSGEIDIKISSSGLPRPIPRDAKVQLFHIGQEAIANAVRHADPTHLTIKIDYENDLTRLIITDNGRGFTTRGDLLGFGIRGMRKRASEINADFDLVSVPGVGTTVTVNFPIGKRKNLFYLFRVMHNNFRLGRRLLQ